MARTYKEHEKVAAKAEVLRHMNLGMGVKASSNASGVTPATVYRWMQDDPQFKEDCEGANDKTVGVYTTALMEAAKNGNASAITFFLQRRGGDDWRENMDAKQLEAITKLIGIITGNGSLIPNKPELSETVVTEAGIDR